MGKSHSEVVFVRMYILIHSEFTNEVLHNCTLAPFNKGNNKLKSAYSKFTVNMHPNNRVAHLSYPCP